LLLSLWLQSIPGGIFLARGKLLEIMLDYSATFPECV
jgi:hypothetical protein